MIHLVGDLQGCCDAFDRLLADIGFSPSRDQLYVLGDLVNRGPESLRTLERLASFGASATCLLGNHDLNLLAVDQGVRRLHRSDTLDDILASPRRRHWIEWLRHQRLAVQAHGWLMVHAGVVPQWDAQQTLALAAEVEQLLRGPDLAEFLPLMHGNEPVLWDDTLQGVARWRVVINSLTRVRFCSADGAMDFKLKEGANTAPPGLMPWFDVPGRRTAGTPIAFGHWSTLGQLDRPDLLALDTGCVWGGRMTAARVDGGRRELVSVACEQAQAPG
ncbi:symmetrical bis(5'-nucleosyl)-tetraphosphatase [Leptothrix sp. BB-4]